MPANAKLQPIGVGLPNSRPGFAHLKICSFGTEERDKTSAGPESLRNIDAARILEAAPDAMALIDRDGCIVLTNSRTEKMFGYRREELIGQPVEKLMHERFRSDHLKRRSLYRGTPYVRPMGSEIELFGLHRDGHEFPAEISLAPLESEQGVLTLAAIRDITALKRTQDLQASLDFEKMVSGLSKTFVNLPVDRIDHELSCGLKELADALDLDRVSIKLFDSNEEGRTTGHVWSRPNIPQLPAQQIEDQAFPWSASRIANHEACCVSSLKSLPEEAAAEREYMLSTGLKSWMVVPLLAGGEYLGTIGASVFRRTQTWDSQSISRFEHAAEIFACALARRRAAKSQMESEERFRIIADAAPVLIWVSNTDKLRTFSNQGWLAFTGRTSEQELGNGWISQVHPEDMKGCVEGRSAAFDLRLEFTLEYRLRRHDGEFRWIVDHGVPMFDFNGRFRGYIGSAIDVSERKRSENSIAEQLKLETMLADLLASFINVPIDQLDSQIEEGQKRICQALALDCSTLAQFLPDSKDAAVTHSWEAEGCDRIPKFISDDFPWIARTVLEGERVTFTRIDDLPERAAKDKQSLRLHGPQSSVVFPILEAGKVIGALTFGSLQAERLWPEALVERLGMVAQVFANALARSRADKDLHQAYRQIEGLKHQLEKENLYLREEVKLEHQHNGVIGNSEAIRRVLKSVEQVAGTDSTVLLLGETGTGKELIAHAIHKHSLRKDRVMVKVNCAALPGSLIESELFGREKGAFTGALTREIGRFEVASGSTILLDEVGELPIELQAKLLRVLQFGEFERLGSAKTIKVDVRVIAATSKNLQQAVREGKFREDLFYRLNVFPITVPSLRERREDIPQLVWHFVHQLSQRMGRSIETIQSSTMEAFKNYYWPGNVRELQNVIERFMITTTNTVFRAELPIAEANADNSHFQTFEELERNHFLRVLEGVGWRIRGEAGAARILGLKPTTLESRMQKLGISRHK